MVAIGVQLVLGCGFLFYCHKEYSEIPLTPVLPRQHAEALIDLGKDSSLDSMIWTWWDWGYASQYYAELATVVDGGKHAGRDVFPVGFALANHSMEQANRMIRFSSQHPPRTRYILGYDPAKVWDAVPRDEISATLEQQLSISDYPVKVPQYIVIAWKDFTIAKWITFFGNWDLGTGPHVKHLSAIIALANSVSISKEAPS